MDNFYAAFLDGRVAYHDVEDAAIRQEVVEGLNALDVLLVVACFLAGGLLGALAFASFDYRALYLPAVVTGVTGLSYAAWKHRKLATDEHR